MASSARQSSTFSRKYRTFLRWMRDNGIEYSDGLVFELGGRGSVADIGVRALYSLQTNDLIATIPKQACLTVKTTACAKILEEEKIGGGFGLVVALMYERGLEEKSRWYGYLQFLPIEQKLPFLWNLEEIDSLLMGTELHKVIKEDRILLEEDWKESIVPLSLQHAKDFPGKWCTLEHFLTAKMLVSSRAFQVDEYHGYGMVPLADLFNHKTAAEDVHFTSVSSDSDSGSDSETIKSPQVLGDQNNVKIEKIQRQFIMGGQNNVKTEKTQRQLNDGKHHSESCNGAGESSDASSSAWEGSSDILEMILVKDVREGCEIFNTYGTLSNAALLHRYGFTEPDNPFDIVNIDLSLLFDICLQSFSSRHIRRRTAQWRQVGCTPCISEDCEYFEISTDGEPQEELLMLLYLVHLPEKDFEHLSNLESGSHGGVETTARALGWAGPPAKGVETQSKKRTSKSRHPPVGRKKKSQKGKIELRLWLLNMPVCHSMLSLLRERDNLYPPSSLEDDLGLLARTNWNEHPHWFHAFRLKCSERSILKRCQAYVSQRLCEHGLR